MTPDTFAGYLVVLQGDLFGAVVMVFAALALIGTLRGTSSQRS